RHEPAVAGMCPSSGSPAGLTLSQFAAPGPIGFSTKIWSGSSTGNVVFVGVVSCQVTHGPGLVGSTAEPPATDGFSAFRLVSMLSEGTGGPSSLPLPRPWPAKIHLPLALSKRLPKTFFSFLKPFPFVLSYQAAPGTVLPAPAKSIAGASPSWPLSKLSEPGNSGDPLERPPTVPLPRVVH